MKKVQLNSINKNKMDLNNRIMKDHPPSSVSNIIIINITCQDYIRDKKMIFN